METLSKILYNKLTKPRKGCFHIKKYITNNRYFTSDLEKNPVTKLPIDIKIENTIILGMYANKTHLGLHVKSTSIKTTCKHCNSIIKRKKGYSTSVIIYASINNRLLLIKIDNQKYKCLDCNKVTTEQLIEKDGFKRMTNDVKKGLIEDFAKEESISLAYIGKKYSLTRNRVLQIFKENINIEEVDFEKVEHICIDENKIMQNKSKGYTYQLIILDAKTKRILHIETDRKKKNVEKALRKFPNVKTISTDLWSQYRDTIILVFGENVKIIPDNFHVVRLFTWAFSRTRRAIYEEYKQSKSLHWRILTKRESELKDYAKEILEKTLKKYPKLEPAHKAKEMVYDIFTKKENVSKEDAVKNFKDKLNELKSYVQENKLIEFETPLETIEEWSKHIENIFIYPELSNGILERVNSSIKYIKRAARGFKNPEIMKQIVKLKINKKFS